MADKRSSRISATEARVHFGEMMRRAEQGETLVVERSGEPRVAIVSIEEYNRLSEHHPTVDTNDEATKPEWQRMLDETGNRLREELNGKKIDWDKIIHDMRNERDEELLENLR